MSDPDPATGYKRVSWHFRNTVFRMPQAKSGKGADGPNSTADPAWQPPDGCPVDAAQRRDGKGNRAGSPGPAPGAQRFGFRMAQGRKGRGQKGQRRTGLSRPPQIGRTMRRAGDELVDPLWARAAARANVHSSPQSCRQSDIAGDHENEPPGTADPRQVASQRGAPGLAIVTEHDTGQAARQLRCCRSWVGQAARIGEQPQWRQSASVASCDAVGPGDEASVHAGYDPCHMARKAASR